MLVAEELVVLALDADGTAAKLTTHATAVDIGASAALVVDLVLDGHVVPDARRRIADALAAAPRGPAVCHVVAAARTYIAQRASW